MSINLIQSMKESIAQAGANKRDIVYFKPDEVQRFRFLTELDAGITISMHNLFSPDPNGGIFAPCEDPDEHESCKYCKQEINLQEWYAWSVWDYDSSSVRIIFQKATGISPVPAFIEYYEEYGTILDRDYKVKKVGKGKGASFVITPLEKSAFKNRKAKPYSDENVRDIVFKAYGGSDEETEEKEEKPAKKSKGKKTEKSLKEKYIELEADELKSIALEAGMSKKEIKQFDEEELVDELFENYEESDLADLLEELESDDE